MCDRGHTLIQDLLNFNPKAFPVKQVLPFKGWLMSHNLTWQRMVHPYPFHLSCMVDASILANQSLLERALMNLYVNAKQAIDHKKEYLQQNEASCTDHSSVVRENTLEEDFISVHLLPYSHYVQKQDVEHIKHEIHGDSEIDEASSMHEFHRDEGLHEHEYAYKQKHPFDHKEPTTHESHVVLVVKDSGIGMKDHVKERILEPYFTTKKRSGGTGIGLANVWYACEQHQARLLIDSEWLQGSTFTIIFPIHDGVT